MTDREDDFDRTAQDSEGRQVQQELERQLRELGDTMDMKLKFVLQPLRVAVCGNMVSPPLFESIELLPREDVLARIDQVTAQVFGA